MKDREKKLRMIKTLAATLDAKSCEPLGIEQFTGGIIMSIIYLGCNCAEFKSDEIHPLVIAVEEGLRRLEINET